MIGESGGEPKTTVEEILAQPDLKTFDHALLVVNERDCLPEFAKARAFEDFVIEE